MWAQYLMNQLADFNQICMDITFGHDKKLNRFWWSWSNFQGGERGGSVVECRTLEREVGVSILTAAVLCPLARHFTPRKYWLITQEAVAPSRHDWKIVDWDVKPQHKQTNKIFKVTVRLNPPKLSQKVFVYMLSHGPLDGMLPNLQAYINQTGSIAY